MPYVKNWLHCVWGTKNRAQFLLGDIKFDVINHIRVNAKAKGIYIDFLNGHTEHIHCLLSLNHDQSLSKVIQLIKGESSFWINKNSLTRNKFEWAEEYFGISVSDSHLPRVREYIKNQEQHHKIRTWQEEYDEFMEKYGFNNFMG
ncbi:MAG: IS200/IS605 family transposase [Bacteroidia bacterium]|nr:IS200/IS605 family transposase [Bacteroidia bacterium]